MTITIKTYFNLAVFTCLIVFSSAFSCLASATGKIAIIIDDIGYRQSDVAAFSLPPEVTFSILPHTEHSYAFSYHAASQDRDVMLHMPMESLHNDNLGTGAILSNMYPQQVQEALISALESVPHAIGINNHMGSRLTQMTLQMTTIMQTLKNNRLFFVDSRTTRFTRAHNIAQQQGVASASRHIFLDHNVDIASINRQFELLVKKAKRQGKAIGIAHPHPMTIRYLTDKLVQLDADVELISMSDYMNIQKPKSYPQTQIASSPQIAPN